MIKQITEILGRLKHSDSFAGDMKYSDEEYAEMIVREVVDPKLNIQADEKSVLEKLHAIDEAKCIYNIHYCKAGVGFCFYEGDLDRKNDPSFLERLEAYPKAVWRNKLVTDRYYTTFEEAVEGEYAKLLSNDN